MSKQNKQTQTTEKKDPQQPLRQPPIQRQSPMEAPGDSTRIRQRPIQEAPAQEPDRREPTKAQIALFSRLIKSPIFWVALVLLLALFLIFGPQLTVPEESFAPEYTQQAEPTAAPYVFTLEEVPPFNGQPYVALRDNQPPLMEETDWPSEAFEYYNPLDELGRCQSVYANLGKELMPTTPRESISSVKPSGWKSYMYDFVDGRSLYNRCHLIGFQLAGENANKLNLVTGTRYMNTQGMLPFEEMVADYIKETNRHVLYRVTPVFVGDELVCRGVLMEGMSLEDQGEDILFYVFCYNVQPGVVINYATGESREK